MIKSELQKQRDRAHEILSRAFDEAGIVDGFYCGITITGADVSAFKVGRDNSVEYSNIERCQRLLGAVESCKYSLLTMAHKEEQAEGGVG